jgi:putative ABC transport system permease protein
VKRTVKPPFLVAIGITLSATCLVPARAFAQLRPPAPDSTIGIAVQRRFAEAARLRVGDTVQVSSAEAAGWRMALIVAVYEPLPDPSSIMRRDYQVRLHLSDLATLVRQPDRVDRIGIVLRPGIDPDTAATRLNRTAFGYDVSPSRAIASQSSMTFVVVSRFHRAIAVISVLASTVFLLCLMLLKVEERRRDVAMLRFTGISRRTVFIALVFEAAIIALAGSMIGAGIAVAASAAVNAYYQRAFETSLIFSQLTSTTMLFALALSVLLGLAAGALAAWRMVRTAPVELWSRAA